MTFIEMGNFVLTSITTFNKKNKIYCKETKYQ